MGPKQEKGEMGVTAGIVIVIIVLIIGAIYFFNQRIEKQKQIAAMNQPSDNIADMSADASAMNFDDLGDGVDNL